MINTTAITRYDRFLGAMFGLAYGDAAGFPALFHRFQTTPRKRHEFLWRTNASLDDQRILRLMLPYTHRLPAAWLDPYPTDDTEFAVFTLRALLNAPARPDQTAFLNAWKAEILPVAETVKSSFSERAAIENLARGLLPPDTGNDNPLHYEDCGAVRAVPIGLYWAGKPDEAAALAAVESAITQAEDGIFAAQAMAASVAVLADGGALSAALEHGRRAFPAGSWIARMDGVARECLHEAASTSDLALLLARQVINTVYSFGSAAPETVPAAFALAEACDGDLHQAVMHANLIPKAADSLPALVGALCGCHGGIGQIGPAWRQALGTLHGLCLPFLEGADLEVLTGQLFAQSERERGAHG